MNKTLIVRLFILCIYFFNTVNTGCNVILLGLFSVYYGRCNLRNRSYLAKLDA